jgi:hypothetical protein
MTASWWPQALPWKWELCSRIPGPCASLEKVFPVRLPVRLAVCLSDHPSVRRSASTAHVADNVVLGLWICSHVAFLCLSKCSIGRHFRHAHNGRKLWNDSPPVSGPGFEINISGTPSVNSSLNRNVWSTVVDVRFLVVVQGFEKPQPDTDTTRYNAIQYNTIIRYDTIQWNAIQCNTRQHNTSQYSAIHYTLPYNTIQYSTVQHSTVQYTTVQYSTVPWSTRQDSTVQCSTIHIQYNRCNTIPYITIQCNTIQYDAIRYNAMQCNPMRCNAMQCNVVQCNAVQCDVVLCIAVPCDARQCNVMLCIAM